MLTIHRLSAQEATILLQGAEAKAREIGVPMCIAVTDESGHLISFLRMDGAKTSSIDIAVNKAWTAASAKRASHDYSHLAGVGGPSFGLNTTNDGKFTIIGGGLPIVVNGEVIGAVGCSTGTPEEDRQVAESAIQYLFDRGSLNV